MSDEKVKEAWEKLLKEQLDLRKNLHEFIERKMIEERYGTFTRIEFPPPKGWRARLKAWLLKKSEYPIVDWLWDEDDHGKG